MVYVSVLGLDSVLLYWYIGIGIGVGIGVFGGDVGGVDGDM